MPKPSYRPGQPSKEFERFVDREVQQAIFARYLNMPAGQLRRLPALMFFGVGGIGKSWLLRYLQGQLKSIWRGVPTVRIDFTLEGASNRFRDDPTAALAAIRDVTEAECPRFDLAWAFVQVRRGVRDESILDRPGRRTAFGVVNEFIKGALGMIPGPGLALQLGYSVLAKLYPHLQSKIGNEKLARLLQQDLQILRDSSPEDIEKTLVWRLAEDLRAETAFPLRSYNAVQAVIFIDTLEAVEPIDASTSVLEIRTRWLRDLICELNDRVLFVLAGQNRLVWERIDPDWADDAWLEQHLVHGLSDGDASQFLIRCGIDDPAVRKAMLAACLASEGGYHTFHLGLLADIVWVEQEVNRRSVTPSLFASLPAGDWTAIALRFLKSLTDESDADWIRRLALTPEFDQSAARAAYSDQASQSQDTHWRMLRSFSFLLPLEDTPGWFTVHSAMRRATAEDLNRDTERIRLTHEWWLEYWRRRTENPRDVAAPLAWYHLWQLAPERALDEWRQLAESARSVPEVDMPFQYRLLAWWQPVNLLERGSWTQLEAGAANCIASECCLASLGNRSENVGAAIAYCQKALEVFSKETHPSEWARTQNNLSNAFRNLRTGDREEHLRDAIACCERALEVYTREEYPEEWARTQHNLGLSFAHQRQLFKTDQRSDQLREAIRYYERALEIYTRDAYPYEWARAQNNLGNAHRNLLHGDRVEHVREAIGCYQLALEVFTREKYPHEWARAQNNLGDAYRYLPSSVRNESRQKAIECYNRALEVHTFHAYPAEWARAKSSLSRVRIGKADATFEEARRMAGRVRLSAEHERPSDVRKKIRALKAESRSLHLSPSDRQEILAMLDEASLIVTSRMQKRRLEWFEHQKHWGKRQERWIKKTIQLVERDRKYVATLEQKIASLIERLNKARREEVVDRLRRRINEKSAEAAQLREAISKIEVKIEAARNRVREASSRTV